MHLRISEEAEMSGLDMDQFFEEQIGDWGMFEELNRRRMELAISAPGTPQVESVVAPVDGAEKKD
jgi:Amt family ammonium transporter